MKNDLSEPIENADRCSRTYRHKKSTQFFIKNVSI